MQKYNFNKLNISILLAIFLLSNCTMMNKIPTNNDEYSAIAIEDELFRTKAPVPGPAPEIIIPEPIKFTLQNGLQIIIVENHKTPLISMQLFVDMGKINFGNKIGLDSLTAELLLHGTKNRSKSTFDESIDNLGAEISVTSQGMFGNVLSKYTSTFFELFSDALLHPLFEQSSFDLVIKQTEAGLESQKDSSEAIASKVAARINFGLHHPQGQFLTTESISQITLEDIIIFHETFYDPSQSYFLITGDVDTLEIRSLCEKYFSGWTRLDNKKSNCTKAESLENSDFDIVNRPNAVQSFLLLTYPVSLKPTDSDIIGASLMNSLLGGYFSSRLNVNLREKHGYTYGVRSSLRSDVDNGIFTITTNVRNEVTAAAIKEILTEMSNLQIEEVSENELNGVKNIISGQFARSLQNPGVLARFALDIARFNLPDDYFRNYLKNISKVKTKDISEAAKKFIHPDKFHLIIIGNYNEILPQLKSNFKDIPINLFNFDGTPYEFTISDKDPKAAHSIIRRYLDSIGGINLLAQINTLTRKDEMVINDVKLISNTYIKNPSNLRLSIMLDSLEIQATLINDTIGYIQENEIIKEIPHEQYLKIKETAIPIEDLNYLHANYSLSYIGFDSATNSFKIEVNSLAGNKRIEFYDKSTGLKNITQIYTGDILDQTIFYLNYSEMDGIKFPTKYEIRGTLPQPVIVKNISIILNQPINPKIFDKI